MRGIAEYNFPAFNECESYVRNWMLDTVFNPARRDAEQGFDATGLTGFEDLESLGFDLRAAMKADLDFIINQGTAIIMLPGWSVSSGAQHEKATAELLGQRVWYYDPVAERGNRVRHEPLAQDMPSAQGHWDELVTEAHANMKGEVRVTNELTGGQKGSKPERYDLVPVEPLSELARVYGYGATKYADRNWEQGYDWSLSYAALQRHVNAFWGGITYDDETGLHHLAHAMFHCMAMIEWSRTHPELDDRPVIFDPPTDWSEEITKAYDLIRVDL
jgi:hypothetical protein